MVNGYMIKYKNGRYGQRIYKTKSKALQSIKNQIKNNSLKVRKQVGAIGMKVVMVKLNPREELSMKRVTDFIRT